MTRVLRLKPGAQVELINGQGVLLTAEIVSSSGHRVQVRVLQRHSEVSPCAPRIILACAVPKRVKFEDIIDKCTQLGVDEIIPMQTERTEVLLRGRDTAAKFARFEKVAVAALKQSRRLWMPVVSRPYEFYEVVQRISSETLAVIPWLEGDRRGLKDVLGLVPGKKQILILIGPEGDFSADEVARAMSKGAIPVSLGNNVLRVDTAASLAVGVFSILGRQPV